MAAHPLGGPRRQLAVAEVIEAATRPETSTVAKHCHDLHNLFDAPGAVNDPLRPGDPPESIDDFLDLVSRYERRVASVVRRFLDDPRDIEEAVQDTFVQAWRHRHGFRAESAVFTWLYRIATNVALMRLRRRRSPPVAIDDLGRDDATALSHDPLDEHADRLAVIDRVRAALGDLPEHHRVIVLLRDVEGLSNTEAAELLGLPVTTVKAHLHRGRSALRKALHSD